MPVTQKEIAAKLGVSRQLVNFALNGGGTVSDRMRREILEAASELGYRRNQLASAMATGKYQVIGFVKMHTDEQIGYMLSGVLEEASEQNYSVKVIQGRRDLPPQELVDRCLEMRLAGYVALQLPLEHQRMLQAELESANIPLAFLDNSFPQSHGIRVVGDDKMGMSLAVEYLHGLGHRHIALLGGPEASGSAAAREAGFIAAMSLLGLPLKDAIVRAGYFDDEKVELLTCQLLRMPTRPTAIVCISDLMAMVVCRTARAFGVQVPTQLSVIGYDDLSMASRSDPPLTTIAQPFETMGRVAASSLLRVINSTPGSEIDPIAEILPARLVVRGSTGPTSAI